MRELGPYPDVASLMSGPTDRCIAWSVIDDPTSWRALGLAGQSHIELPLALFSIPADVIDAAVGRLPQLDLPLRNYFPPAIYARELTIPRGTLLTGRRHKARHLSVISAGEMTVWGDGVAPLVVRAPFAIIAQPGTRRVGYAHEETIWTTFFPNPGEERDPDRILDRWTEVPVLPPLLIGIDLPEVIRAMLTGDGAKLLPAGDPGL